MRLAAGALILLTQAAGAARPAVPGAKPRSTAALAAVRQRFLVPHAGSVRSPLASLEPQSTPSHRARGLPAVQVAYLTSCGGCHGVEGVSAPREVPTLRHLTGAFLCTRQGRQYIVRLPDVALSVLSNRMLTRVINWVAFDLGAPVAGGRTTRPYTVAEVTRLRGHPLTHTPLTRYREQVVAHLASRCAVPAGLRVYGAAYESAIRRAPRS